MELDAAFARAPIASAVVARIGAAITRIGCRILRTAVLVRVAVVRRIVLLGRAALRARGPGVIGGAGRAVPGGSGGRGRRTSLALGGGGRGVVGVIDAGSWVPRRFRNSDDASTDRA